ncbi:hypothetical protein GQ457_09G003430 [Hibiscus cannabinus]
MGISSVDLMGSSVIINVPSPPSSSSSSSSSSRVHQMAENEGEDRSGMGLEGKIPDRNRFSKRLGREVPRLILDELENERMLPSLNRGIEELDKGENQLNLEIEDLERKVVMLMIAKGLKGGEKLGKFGDAEDILKAMKLNDKLNELGIGAEERRKRSGKDKISKPDKKKVVQKTEKTGKVLDESKNASDGDNLEKDEKKLSKEIEILEAMLERGSYGLLDLQMMMEEVKAMKGSEKMVCEIKEKMTELESDLWELKDAIAELKSKKGKQLMGRVKKEEENEMKYEKREQQQQQDYEEEEEEEEDNGSKINWCSIIASVGAVAVAAAAAVFFMGRSSSRVGITSEKKNRRQNESC